MINHKDIEPFLLTALSCKVSTEFKLYCEGTNSILKGTSPEELAAYSNRFVAQETKVMCPFWHTSLPGACGVHKCQEKKIMLYYWVAKPSRNLCFISWVFLLFFSMSEKVLPVTPLLSGVFVHRVFCAYFVRFEEAGVMRRFPCTKKNI